MRLISAQSNFLQRATNAVIATDHVSKQRSLESPCSQISHGGRHLRHQSLARAKEFSALMLEYDSVLVVFAECRMARRLGFRFLRDASVVTALRPATVVCCSAASFAPSFLAARGNSTPEQTVERSPCQGSPLIPRPDRRYAPASVDIPAGPAPVRERVIGAAGLRASAGQPGGAVRGRRAAICRPSPGHASTRARPRPRPRAARSPDRTIQSARRREAA